MRLSDSTIFTSKASSVRGRMVGDGAGKKANKSQVQKCPVSSDYRCVLSRILKKMRSICMCVCVFLRSVLLRYVHFILHKFYL